MQAVSRAHSVCCGVYCPLGKVEGMNWLDCGYLWRSKYYMRFQGEVRTQNPFQPSSDVLHQELGETILLPAEALD
jgi:hypothetical protein